MKELKKTQRIFTAGIVFFAAILIGVLTYTKPKLVYSIDSKEALKLIGKSDKMISIKDATSGSYKWVDVRNQFEYANGHIGEATNIYSADLFLPFSMRYFKQLKKEGHKVILYGQDIHEASNPWLILSQMGFDNIYYLKEGYQGYQMFAKKKSLKGIHEPEKPDLDYAKFFVEARKKAKENGARMAGAKSKKRKSVVIRKRKKKKVGGC